MTLTRDGIAYRVARDLPEGAYVNLGIGIPFLITSYLAPDREIFIHSENGILGVGPVAKKGKEDPDLVNASKDYITLLPGSSVFDHALSFTMIRGGHLTHAVIGAIEVAANGDLANWRVPGQKVPGVGGAMDIAVGIENLYVAMTHTTNKGQVENPDSMYMSIDGPCLRQTHLYGHGADRRDARRTRSARGGAWIDAVGRRKSYRSSTESCRRLPADGRAARLQWRPVASIIHG